MLDAWRTAARDAVRRNGYAGASWRFATLAALLVMACATPVWLRAYLTTGYLPMLPVLGAASLVTFVVAAIGYPASALLWTVGRQRAARTVAIAALVGWLLTTVVFQLWLGGTLQVEGQVDAAQASLLAWTFLAVIAVAALWQPPSRARGAAAATLLVAMTAAFVFARGGVPLEDTGGYGALEGAAGWLPSLLDRGSLDTLHTAVLIGWVLLLVLGVLSSRIDRRPILAAVWLAPFVAMSQLRSAGAVMIGIGLMVTAGVLALGLRSAPRPAS